MTALDRILCERLGIEPAEHWVVGDEASCCYSGTRAVCQQWLDDHPEYCAIRGYSVRAWLLYPALSTTGDGMVLLMEALPKYGWNYRVEQDGHLSPVAFVRSWPHDWARKQAATAPMALALAAAAALGVEVPE